MLEHPPAVGSCFSYSFSVELVSNFQLSSGWVDGEGAALVTVHDGVPHMTVGGPVQVLSIHLEIKNQP